MNESGNGELSEREREILQFVATGASNKEIAQKLFISPNTVKVHLRNIFAKIGAASRTEATLYAIRNGITQVEMPAQSSGEEKSPLTETIVEATRAPITSKPLAVMHPHLSWRILSTSVAVAVVLVAAMAGFWLRGPGVAPLPTSVPSPAPTMVRWEEKAPMLTARSALAAAVYDSRIYAIGGDTENGVTGIVERFDPKTDSWATLTPKPVPVADVRAATIGAKIYVPGGRLASGKETDTLEVYDTLRDKWETRAPMPKALSAYAMAAFEGKLYLFGGNTERRSTNTVFRYDPDQDVWESLEPLTRPRSFSGAAALGERIYVIGGQSNSGALTIAESFQPSLVGIGTSPWRSLKSLPVQMVAMEVIPFVDRLLVFGGWNGADPFPPLAYLPTVDEWQTLDFPGNHQRRASAIATLGTVVYLIGGQETGVPVSDLLAYQTIVTLNLPIIVR